MRVISVLDTSITSYNMGNDIIMEAVLKELLDIFPNDFFYRIPTCDIGNFTTDILNKSNFIILGGTNALCGNMETYSQTDIERASINGKIMLMGVGWWQYENEISVKSKKMLLHMLEDRLPLSVRDTYTKRKLEQIGFSNILMTGCPTLWRLNEEHMKKIPQHINSEIALMTITDYHLAPDKDLSMINTVREKYKKLFFWAQGIGDMKYLTRVLGISQEQIIAPSLVAYDTFLTEHHPDYIGTRLHGGIRALQKGCRALIIANDNRALEMKKDINLPVCTYEELSGKLDMPIAPLTLPYKAILQWKTAIRNSIYTEIENKTPNNPRYYDFHAIDLFWELKDFVKKILFLNNKKR